MSPMGGLAGRRAVALANPAGSIFISRQFARRMAPMGRPTGRRPLGLADTACPIWLFSDLTSFIASIGRAQSRLRTLRVRWALQADARLVF